MRPLTGGGPGPLGCASRVGEPHAGRGPRRREDARTELTTARATPGPRGARGHGGPSVPRAGSPGGAFAPSGPAGRRGKAGGGG